MNFFYHLGTYKNYEEAKLFANLVSWASASPSQIPDATGYTARQDNPEQNTVVLNQAAHGVLLKQFWYDDWKATVAMSNGTSEALPIYMAGPDFMYVALPSGMSFPATVTFTFDKTVDYIGLAISIVTLTWLVAYALFGPRTARFGKFLAEPRRRLGEKIQKRWCKEE
jgi:hypothetical protein